MINKLPKPLQAVLGGCAAAAVALVLSTSGTTAQQEFIITKDGFTQGKISESNVKSRRVIRAERYIPTIWVDPDGCEHWVFDDGFEGYMTPHVRRDGRPVCRGRKN